MKFVISPRSLLLVFTVICPAFAGAASCSVCTGFDETKMIDIPILQTSFQEVLGQELRSEDLYSSCAKLKTDIESTVDDERSCLLYDLISFFWCGCSNPPVDTCFYCPDGSVIPNIGLIPSITGSLDITKEGEKKKSCKEIAFATSLAEMFEPATVIDKVKNYEAVTHCAAVHSACECPGSTECEICQYGVKNPYELVMTHTKSVVSCIEFAHELELLSFSETLCAENKRSFEGEYGCKCINPALETQSPVANAPPSASPVVPLLVIPDTATPVADTTPIIAPSSGTAKHCMTVKTMGLFLVVYLFLTV
mmetsp:Transcript_30697/g.46795  ORF Transcript_30697/g.46795 Transcript_30697/m.46795 type:complete len:309 (+) Transcript_30697:49-975(+)